MKNHGLGEKQLSKQNLSEVRTSLTLLNGCIAKPLSFLELKSGVRWSRNERLEKMIIGTLIEIKRFALIRYDVLVNQTKFSKIRKILVGMSDRAAQTAIEHSLYQLELKDQVLKKEIRKLDQMRKNLIID